MFLRDISALPDPRKHCHVANGGNVFVKVWNVAMFEMVEGLWLRVERSVNWQTAVKFVRLRLKRSNVRLCVDKVCFYERVVDT